MGVSDGETYGNTTKRSKRGSTNNKNRLAAFTKKKSVGEAEWSGCDPQMLQDVVAMITSMGGAVTFGLSRDQGAHMLTLLLDESKETLWFNGDADLTAELNTVCQMLKE